MKILQPSYISFLKLSLNSKYSFKSSNFQKSQEKLFKISFFFEKSPSVKNLNGSMCKANIPQNLNKQKIFNYKNHILLYTQWPNSKESFKFWGIKMLWKYQKNKKIMSWVVTASLFDLFYDFPLKSNELPKNVYLLYFVSVYIISIFLQ